MAKDKHPDRNRDLRLLARMQRLGMIEYSEIEWPEWEAYKADYAREGAEFYMQNWPDVLGAYAAKHPADKRIRKTLSRMHRDCSGGPEIVGLVARAYEDAASVMSHPARTVADMRRDTGVALLDHWRDRRAERDGFGGEFEALAGYRAGARPAPMSGPAVVDDSGAPILFGGELTLLVGPPKSGKSLSSLATAAVAGRHGARALYVCYERRGVTEARRDALGPSGRDILVVGPDDLDEMGRAGARTLRKWLGAGRGGLVVLDSLTSGGVSYQPGDNFADWFNVHVRPWLAPTVAVLGIAHTPKAGGDAPIGSVSQTAIADAVYSISGSGPITAPRHIRRVSSARLDCPETLLLSMVDGTPHIADADAPGRLSVVR